MVFRVLLVLAMACTGYANEIAPDPPRVRMETRWLSPGVGVVTGAWGEPMFVVDGGYWLWRDSRWMVWEGLGWRWAEPPRSLEAMGWHEP